MSRFTKRYNKKMKSEKFISLDLHGYTHSDARDVVIEFVEKNFDIEGKYYIITGNSDYMKQIVFDVLGEYSIGWSTDPFNDGRIYFDYE